MAITVADFFTRVALDLHEDDNTFPSGLWTQEEMVGYLNYAERDFMTRSGVLKVDESVTLAPGSPILVDKPDDVIDMERVSFNRKRIRRVTSWDLEKENPQWRAQSAGQPKYYHEDHINVNKFEIDRIPLAGGTIRIFSDKLPPEHTTDLTELVGVEDYWEQYIRWEVLSLALGKDGDNQDVARSTYAHQRYLLGVALAKRLILGTTVASIQEA